MKPGKNVTCQKNMKIHFFKLKSELFEGENLHEKLLLPHFSSTTTGSNEATKLNKNMLPR